MNTNREMMYWFRNDDWYKCDDQTEEFSIRDDAPDRVKRSFKMWQEFVERNERLHGKSAKR